MDAIKNIRELMLSYLSVNKNKLDFNYVENYPYDIDGYCSRLLYEKILDFWIHFDSNEKLLFVASGEFCTELDLDGGRSYLLPEEEIGELIVKYLYFNMKINKKQFVDLIFNTCCLTDHIEELYGNKIFIRDININKILE